MASMTASESIISVKLPVHPASRSSGTSEAMTPAGRKRRLVRSSRNTPDCIADVVCDKQSALFVLHQPDGRAIQLRFVG